MSNIPGSGSILLQKTLSEFMKLNEYYPPEKGILLMVSIREQPVAEMTTEELRDKLQEMDDAGELCEWRAKLIEELESRGS